MGTTTAVESTHCCYTIAKSLREQLLGSFEKTEYQQKRDLRSLVVTAFVTSLSLSQTFPFISYCLLLTSWVSLNLQLCFFVVLIFCAVLSFRWFGFWFFFSYDLPRLPRVPLAIMYWTEDSLSSNNYFSVQSRPAYVSKKSEKHRSSCLLSPAEIPHRTDDNRYQIQPAPIAASSSKPVVFSIPHNKTSLVAGHVLGNQISTRC